MSQSPGSKIPELAVELRQELERVVAENETLKGEIEHLQLRKQDAEARAAVAEQHARETEESLAKLRALAEGEYKSVVAQLFKEPSRDAARYTFIATALSIAIGLAATVLSVQYSIRRGSESSAELTKQIAVLLGRRVEESSAKTTQEVKAAEARMTQSVQTAFKVFASGLPPDSIIDVPRNGAIQRTVGSDRDLYFRISVPAGAQRLDVKIATLSGDADLYFKYGEVPLPMEQPSEKLCRSMRTGTDVDACYALTPGAGDWFARVRGGAKGYSTFSIQAIY